MNFLLHHHFAARERGAIAGIGAMLPDLWRMADRRVRPSPSLAPAAPSDDALGALLAGIDHHLEIDRWFHRSVVFTEGERRTVLLLREAGVTARRIGLFAHVIWELCLDGALLRRVGLAPTLDALRAGFAASDEASDRAASLHHWDRVPRPDADRTAFRQRMIRLQAEIARGPWIDGYQNGEGLALRVAGVRARIGFDPMDPDDLGRLASALEVLAHEADPALDALLASRAASTT